MMKTLRRKTGYFLVLRALAVAGLFMSCGCGAAENGEAQLDMWVTGTMILIQTDKEPDEAAEETAENVKTEEDAFTEEAGGNPTENHAAMLEITVFEDHYLYENHEVLFEELLTLLDGLSEGDVVTIYDQDAAWNAYQKVISALDERKILYVNGDSDET